MKKLAILIFSLFIVGVSYAEDCSQTSDGCWQLISNNPTQLLCSNLLVTTMTEGCRNVCAAGAVYSGTNCACDNGFYRTLGGVFDVTGDTCTACPSTWTCNGANAEPLKLCSVYDPVLYNTGNAIYQSNVSGCSCSHPATQTCTPSCSSGYTAVANSGSSALTHCVNNTYGSCTGGTCNPNTISVSYSGNTNTGGSAPSTPISYAFASTTSAPTNTYTKTGYTFTGWECTDGIPGTCDGQIIQPGDNIGSVAYSGTITLTAQWSIATYTITYDLNGGNCPGGTCSPTSYTINTLPITLPLPIKSGSVFAGWFGGAGLTPPTITTIPVGSTGNKAFWAGWTICGVGSWVNAGNCEVCPNGYYCTGTGDFNKVACPRATTTDGTDYSSDEIARSAKKDCKMVQGSKICDNNGVCYTFPNGTSIPWTGI